MKKVFISQSMISLNREAIILKREKIKSDFLKTTIEEVKFIESYLPELEFKHPIDSLGKSLILLSEAHILLAPRDVWLKHKDQTAFDNNFNTVMHEIMLAKSYLIRVQLY